MMRGEILRPVIDNNLLQTRELWKTARRDIGREGERGRGGEGRGDHTCSSGRRWKQGPEEDAEREGGRGKEEAEGGRGRGRGRGRRSQRKKQGKEEEAERGGGRGQRYI